MSPSAQPFSLLVLVYESSIQFYVCLHLLNPSLYSCWSIRAVFNSMCVSICSTLLSTGAGLSEQYSILCVSPSAQPFSLLVLVYQSSIQFYVCLHLLNPSLYSCWSMRAVFNSMCVSICSTLLSTGAGLSEQYSILCVSPSAQPFSLLVLVGESSIQFYVCLHLLNPSLYWCWSIRAVFNSMCVSICSTLLSTRAGLSEQYSILCVSPSAQPFSLLVLVYQSSIQFYVCLHLLNPSLYSCWSIRAVFNSMCVSICSTLLSTRAGLSEQYSILCVSPSAQPFSLLVLVYQSSIQFYMCLHLLNPSLYSCWSIRAVFNSMCVSICSTLLSTRAGLSRDIFSNLFNPFPFCLIFLNFF